MELLWIPGNKLTNATQSVVKCMEFYNPPQLEGIQGDTEREYTNWMKSGGPLGRCPGRDTWKQG